MFLANAAPCARSGGPPGAAALLKALRRDERSVVIGATILASLLRGGSLQHTCRANDLVQPTAAAATSKRERDERAEGAAFLEARRTALTADLDNGLGGDIGMLSGSGRRSGPGGGKQKATKDERRARARKDRASAGSVRPGGRAARGHDERRRGCRRDARKHEEQATWNASQHLRQTPQSKPETGLLYRGWRTKSHRKLLEAPSPGRPVSLSRHARGPSKRKNAMWVGKVLRRCRYVAADDEPRCVRA